MPALAKDASSGTSFPMSKATPIQTFDTLVADLSRVLGPSSGIDSDDVEPSELVKLMEDYVSKHDEWERYAWADYSRAYTRNLVDRGNGRSNLLVLVWTPGKSSPIHDHADAHCVMKVLKGSLRETLFTWPDRNLVNDGQASPLRVKRDTLFTENQVTYMSDNLGLHKITNPDPEKVAVSLHLYTPPNAAKVGCHMYDENTGKSRHIQQSFFFSELGKRSEKSSA